MANGFSVSVEAQEIKVETVQKLIPAGKSKGRAGQNFGSALVG